VDNGQFLKRREILCSKKVKQKKFTLYEAYYEFKNFIDKNTKKIYSDMRCEIYEII
jgi:hypothetical protein